MTVKDRAVERLQDSEPAEQVVADLIREVTLLLIEQGYKHGLTELYDYVSCNYLRDAQFSRQKAFFDELGIEVRVD